MEMQWPNGKEFAFTIFDDTDNGTLENTKQVYDLLQDLNFKTTKSVWIYPPRGLFRGECLADAGYLDWIIELQAKGFEIGLHGVGDGPFSRAEILAGLEMYHRLLGGYPRIHTNHAGNPHNIYWLKDRFNWPFNILYALYCQFTQKGTAASQGHKQGSEFFWGDACKDHIDYIRNFTCRNLNTLQFNPSMPYIDLTRQACSNRWFSSSDGHTVAEFCDLLRPEAVEQLRAQKGACIMYTHFASGFVDGRGQLSPLFRKRMEHLASLNGFYEPTSTILDHLKCHQDPRIAFARPSMAKWITDRLIKQVRYGR